MKIAINGRIVEDQDAVISIYDHGFLYGMGLFETFRTYGGRPFLLEAHLQRLADGCEELGFRYRSDPDALRRLVARLLAENSLPDAYIRLSVSAGTGELGLPGGDYERPNEIVYVKPLPARDERTYAEGKPIRLLQLRRSSPEGSVRRKSFHYMNNVLAKRELRRREGGSLAEGIFLDARGYVAEGIVSNLFWIRDGVLFTPSLATGILAGVTRERVIRLAAEAGLPVREGLFVWTDVVEADEAFLTNSIQEIVPVNRAIDPDGTERSIGAGRPGAHTRRLMQAYAEAVQAE